MDIGNKVQNDDPGQAQPAESCPVPDEKGSKYVLVVTNKAGNLETRHSLEEGKEIIVGADPECSIAVEDDFISFRHFSIQANNGSVEVKDLGSRNGLYLRLDNAEKVTAGQVILAGKTFFKLEEGDGQG